MIFWRGSDGKTKLLAVTFTKLIIIEKLLRIENGKKLIQAIRKAYKHFALITHAHIILLYCKHIDV